MAKTKIRNVHNVQQILTAAQKTEKKNLDEDLTVQGQDEPLGLLYQRLLDGTHIGGEYRVVYHEDDGKVDFDRLPDVNVKVDRLLYMQDQYEKQGNEISRLRQDLDDYKKAIQEKSRSRPKDIEPETPPEPPQ